MYKQYASYYVSYLLTNFPDISLFQRIILFGSATRDQATKKSDIDIFIEVEKKSKNLENNIEVLTESFYTSKEGLLFKIKNIDNKINVIVGKLNDWPDLKRSIESTGIILFGHYGSSDKDGKKQCIITWDKIGKNRGAFLNKLYGVTIKGKRYQGLIQKWEGKKLGKSGIMIPIMHTPEFLKLITQYKVNAKIIEVYS